MAEEITLENFGAVDPVAGGPGARGVPIRDDRASNGSQASGGRDGHPRGAGAYSPEAHAQ